MNLLVDETNYFSLEFETVTPECLALSVPGNIDIPSSRAIRAWHPRILIHDRTLTMHMSSSAGCATLR